MNKNRRFVLVLFALSCLVIPIGIVTSLPTGLKTESTDGFVTADEYDFSNRRSPINILMYIEDADTESGGEFENVYQSILETYGDDFQYENLTDYTQLAPRVFDFDVFLILEQEIESENFSTIGQSWASALTDYVNQGGVVIQTDGGYYSTDGGGKILNGTGLIKTSDAEIVSGNTVDIVEATDPVVFNATSYTAPGATWAFHVTDAESVAKDSVTTKTVVAHRQLGLGDVVLIGSSFYERDQEVDIILANAIRLTRLAVFDNSHAQYYNPLTGYSEFAYFIQKYLGFAIATMNSWDSGLVQSCQVFVAGSNYLTVDPFNTTEVQIIDDFVSSGGGLFIISEIWWYGNGTDPLLWNFGYERNYTAASVSDSDDYEDLGTRPVYGPGNIANHSTTIYSSYIQMYGSTGYTTMPDDAIPLIWADTDGTAGWNGSGTFTTDNSGIPVATALLHDSGRIVTLADNSMLHNTDADNDGTDDFYDLYNEWFISNVMIWLSAAGIPERTILFEQSHSPTYSVSSVHEFARLLTLNGFNIRWEDHFSTQLIQESDAVIIINGGENYTSSEIDFLQNYVEQGGGLFLLCDWGNYNQETNEIISRFGMSVNGSSYLTDSDDGWVDSPPSSYIAYFGDNIGNHPIMTGVHRIEIDRGPGFSSIGSGTALVVTDDDGTAGWYNGSAVTGVANSVPVIAANEVNMGRVVVIPDINFLGLGDPDNDDFRTLYDSDNDILTANTFYWLTENRAPSVEVITPNGGEVLNGTVTIEWDALDFDSDPLTFDILYSGNNGSTWFALDSGLTGLSYSWNTSEYANGNSYMIRVIVSDGVEYTFDDSDNPFSIDNIADTGTGTGIGLPLDPFLLAIIGAAVLIVIIILVVVMKKNKK